MALKRIVNASPLIFLSRLGLLDILSGPDIDVLVPDTVLDELGYLDPDDPAASAARTTPWIQIVTTPPIPAALRAWDLGAGETAVLTLALVETGMELDVVIDDLKARRCAVSLGIRVQGTLACLIIAKRIGRIHSIRPLVEELRQSGMYLSDNLMERVLRQAGE